FVVSMGDVAGSGGYYVACAADTIFADASTITGSIGVVGGKFATTDMWSKVGIKFKAYERGENASMLSARKTFTPEERERMQKWMDEIYEVFKKHVTDIRGDRLKKPIDELAGGRVYTGKQALELGLVDKIGTMQDAIALAAEQAKITEYEVRIVPEPKNFLEKILEESSGVPEEPQHVDLKTVRAARSASIVDLAMPYVQHLDPQRVSIVKQALRRMQRLQEEGVLLMMPELGM
ncbi:MAG TPA: S49 family peptidase, partial [Planctomycetaceae bacterium]|nr:S49 family peptidase [Planctomycetaceae bacterium]